MLSTVFSLPTISIFGTVAHFRQLPDRRYHEYEGIPEHVRDKHRDKTSFGPVKASPEKGTGEGCKDEHRISRGKMDPGVKKCREDESGPGAPFLSEPSLNKASPEDFLSEPYGEKEQKGDKGRGEPSEVRVNRSDVPCRVGKESRKEPGDKHEKQVSHIENGVQKSSQENSDENILRGELSAQKERPAEGKGEGCEKRSAEGEQDPEIEGSIDEHDDPERKSQHDAGPEPFLRRRFSFKGFHFTHRNAE
jgi:hypothetical protein